MYLTKTPFGQLVTVISRPRLICNRAKLLHGLKSSSPTDLCNGAMVLFSCVHFRQTKSSVVKPVMAMETANRLSHRILPIFGAKRLLKPVTFTPIFRTTHTPTFGPQTPKLGSNTIFTTRRTYNSASPSIAKAGWLLGLGEKKKMSLPDIVKAGDPVLHEPAREVEPEEILSERIQKIIDDMVAVMRKAPGVGLAAPQIGIPLRVSISFTRVNFSSFYVFGCLDAEKI